MDKEKQRVGWRKVVSRIKDWPVVSLVIVLIFLMTAVFAPLIAPYHPTKGDMREGLIPPSWSASGRADHETDHLLGTDKFGRDILSRLIYGARISLVIGLVCLLLGAFIGTTLGIISGFYGGWVDMVIMRVVDISLSLPVILIAVLLAARVGPSFKNVIFIIALYLWPRFARLIRGEVLVVKEREFVTYARGAGCSPNYIMVRHILPNVIPTFLVLVTLNIGFAIILEASLSFLGVGIPPPNPSWGVMVADGRGLIESAWWISLIPGIAIMLLVLSMNIIGDWIRDRLDPKLRQV
jgi:peptide/nickel transport system permease protein